MDGAVFAGIFKVGFLGKVWPLKAGCAYCVMAIAAVPLSRFEERMALDPLNVEHRRELVAARDRSTSIRKAARVAAFNGWTTALIAALSAPFSLFSPVGLALTAGIALVAYNEFRGRKRLLNFDPGGASLLGWNQIGLLAMTTVYCLWSMFTNTAASITLPPELQSADMDALLAQSGGIGDLLDPGFINKLVVYFYSGVIALSALFQGGNALYYFSRRRLVEEYIAETPEWVRDVQRTQSV